MGKVYRHLYPQVHDWENLLLAWRKARKGKLGSPPAASFEMNVAENLYHDIYVVGARTNLSLTPSDNGGWLRNASMNIAMPAIE